jgi:hypothetical protein
LRIKSIESMKSLKLCIAVGCALFVLAGAVSAGTQQPAATKQVVTKLTCCQQAAAQGKECRHKCCVAAHRAGKSCTICNPHQEDLKLLKKRRTPAASPKAAQP